MSLFFYVFGFSLNELNLYIKNKIGRSCTTFFEKSLVNKVRPTEKKNLGTRKQCLKRAVSSLARVLIFVRGPAHERKRNDS